MLQILSGTWASIVSKPWVIQQGGWDGTPATAEKFHDPAAEKDELFKVMNGTGPYKLDRWMPNQEVDLVRNDNYWVKEPLWDGGPTGPAKIQRIIIKDIPEWGTRFAMLKTGDADLITVDRVCRSGRSAGQDTCDYKIISAPAPTRTERCGCIKVADVDCRYDLLNENVNTTGGNNMLGSSQRRQRHPSRLLLGYSHPPGVQLCLRLGHVHQTGLTARLTTFRPHHRWRTGLRCGSLFLQSRSGRRGIQGFDPQVA
jgi:hypothetical protein